MHFRQTLGFLLGAGLLAQASIPAHAQVRRGDTLEEERGSPGCPRARSAMVGLGRELTRISALAACQRSSRPCQYGVESYGPSRHLPGLWFGPASYVFTIREQDRLIADARAAAALVAPPGLLMVELTFTDELYGLAGPPKGVRVNARADYGVCRKRPH